MSRGGSVCLTANWHRCDLNVLGKWGQWTFLSCGQHYECARRFLDSLNWDRVTTWLNCCIRNRYYHRAWKLFIFVLDSNFHFTTWQKKCWHFTQLHLHKIDFIHLQGFFFAKKTFIFIYTDPDNQKTMHGGPRVKWCFSSPFHFCLPVCHFKLKCLTPFSGFVFLTICRRLHFL